MTTTADSRLLVGSWLRRPITWVLIVAVFYGVSQLLLLDSERFLSWDEAVYVSQVSPYADAVSMGAHRARGVTLIAAPVSVLTDSMLPLRIYLAVVSSAACFGAFVIWCRSVRWAAPIAAGLFVSSWLAIYYGSAVYPNIYSALIAVAVIGLAVQLADSRKRSGLYLLGALTALGTLVRPLDALLAAACVVIVGLVKARGYLISLSATVFGGIALGALPWILEGWIRFGGPLEALNAARETVGGGFRNNLSDYLHLLDGSEGAVNRWAALWLGLLLVLGLTALFQREKRLQQASVITLIAAFLLVAPYLFATEPIALRFMLPGYALLCISSALGIRTVALRFAIRPAPVIVFALIVMLTTAWNLQAIQAWDDRQVRNANTALALGQSIKLQAESDQCFFLSPFNHPAVSVASGCRGGPLGENPGENQSRIEAADKGAQVFAVTPNSDPGAVLGNGWQCDAIRSLSDRGWRICTPDA